MNSFKKSMVSCLIAITLVVGGGVVAYAAQDDSIVDEAEIYLNEPQAIPAEPNLSQEENAARFGNATNQLEGVRKAPDIAKSPAVRGSVTEPKVSMQEEVVVAVDTAMQESSPDTGAPSLMLPLGICLMSLGLIPVLRQNKKSK